jgi:hypothetical protein
LHTASPGVVLPVSPAVHELAKKSTVSHVAPKVLAYTSSRCVSVKVKYTSGDVVTRQGGSMSCRAADVLVESEMREPDARLITSAPAQRSFTGLHTDA